MYVPPVVICPVLNMFVICKIKATYLYLLTYLLTYLTHINNQTRIYFILTDCHSDNAIIIYNADNADNRHCRDWLAATSVM